MELNSSQYSLSELQNEFGYLYESEGIIASSNLRDPNNDDETNEARLIHEAREGFDDFSEALDGAIKLLNGKLDENDQ